MHLMNICSEKIKTKTKKSAVKERRFIEKKQTKKLIFLKSFWIKQEQKKKIWEFKQ